MRIFKSLISKVRGIDPFFEEVKKDQIGLYQHYFSKVIRSIDVDTETNWSMSKPIDNEQFRKDETIMEEIIVVEAATEGLSPAILQVIVHQYFFADVYQREMDQEQWVKRVMWRKNPDYFPSGWQVRNLLDAVS